MGGLRNTCFSLSISSSLFSASPFQMTQEGLMAQTFSMVGVKLFQLACVSFITAKWLFAFLPAVVKLYVFSSASVPRIFIL